MHKTFYFFTFFKTKIGSYDEYCFFICFYGFYQLYKSSSNDITINLLSILGTETVFLYYQQWHNEHADVNGVSLGLLHLLELSSYKLNCQVKTYAHFKACITQDTPERLHYSPPTG